MNVVVTGATGFIGTRLCQLLREKGYKVDGIDVRKNSGWERLIEESDAVVNLAGAPLFGKRWDTYVKGEIHDSRVNGTEKVVNALGRAFAKDSQKKRVLVSGSAVGYYGSTGDATITETSEAGTDFLAFVCREWEEAAFKAQLQFHVRTVFLRTGVVIGKGGGALQTMLYPMGGSFFSPFKLGLGGSINSGSQWMPWIHIDDICGLIIHAIENESVKGPLNGTAPNPVRNFDFTKTLGAVLGRPTAIPIPGAALYLAFGEAASILTGGQKVLPEVAQKTGYRFKYSALNEALVASMN